MILLNYLSINDPVSSSFLLPCIYCVLHNCYRPLKCNTAQTCPVASLSNDYSATVYRYTSQHHILVQILARRMDRNAEEREKRPASLLLFQGARIQSPAPTGQLAITCNSSSQGSNTLSGFPGHSHTHIKINT